MPLSLGQRRLTRERSSRLPPRSPLYSRQTRTRTPIRVGIFLAIVEFVYGARRFVGDAALRRLSTIDRCCTACELWTRRALCADALLRFQERTAAAFHLAPSVRPIRHPQSRLP